MTTRERHFLKRNMSPKRGRGGRGARVRQSIWCCGYNYQRWRFLHGEFPDSHPLICLGCERPLDWPEDASRSRAESALVRTRRAARNYQRRRSAGFVRRGLTSKGQPRRRRASISALELSWRDFRNWFDAASA